MQEFQAPSCVCAHSIDDEMIHGPLSRIRPQGVPQAQRLRVIALHTFPMLCPRCVAHSASPTWHVAKWFNANNDLSLEKLRGSETFAAIDVAVVGRHTIFEHHDAMRSHALQAFLHEYRVNFPVGVDAHESSQDIPLTMHAYRMYGAPTLILIGRFGIVRYHVFGRPDDISVGAQVAMLFNERVTTGTSKNSEDVKQETRVGCDDAGCTSIIGLTTSFGDQSTRRMCGKLR